MGIGKNIFELRKARGMTQARLADKLGVSEQAVSKWENDICMPDAGLFPSLARVFCVSIDRLFGYNHVSYEKETALILEKAETMENNEARIGFLEDALKEYPGSEKIMSELSNLWHMELRTAATKQETRKAADKAIGLCREIIGSSLDEKTLDEANIVLAQVLCETGEPDKAAVALDNLSRRVFDKRLIIKSQILAKGKQLDRLREHTEDSLFHCFLAMDLCTDYFAGALEETENYTLALEYCDIRRRVLSVFDEGGEALFAAHKLMTSLRRARVLMKLRMREECLSELRVFASLAVSADKLPSSWRELSSRCHYFTTVEGYEEYIPDTVKFAADILKVVFDGYFSEGDLSRGYQELKDRLGAD